MTDVIELPTSANEGEEKQKDPMEAAKKALQHIDTNRERGLATLKKKCDAFEDRKILSDDNPLTENDLRDLEGGIKGTLTMLEALDSLVQMLRNDLIGLFQEMEKQKVANFQSSVHLQTLLALLKEKGIVSEEELKATWEKHILPQIQKS